VPANESLRSASPANDLQGPRWVYPASVPFRVPATVVAELVTAAVLLLTWVAFSGAILVDLAVQPKNWRRICRGHFIRQPRRNLATLRWVAVRVMALPGHPAGRSPERLE
jgi:hypothetical protein